MSSHYCETCAAQRVFNKPTVNHILHLILSLVTAGLWLIVWALLGISSALSAETCATCGSSALTRETAPISTTPWHLVIAGLILAAIVAYSALCDP